MKTRDIKTTTDVADTTKENQEATKKIEQSSSPSSAPRQRAPRGSKATSQTAVSETKNKVTEEYSKALEEKSHNSPAATKTTSSTITTEQTPEKDIMAQERRDMPQPKEDNRPMPYQQPYYNQMNNGYERPTYTKRPLEDLSLAELVQY